MIRAASSQLLRRASPRASYQGGWYVLRIRKSNGLGIAGKGRRKIPPASSSWIVANPIRTTYRRLARENACEIHFALSDPFLLALLLLPACQMPFGNFTYRRSVKTRRPPPPTSLPPQRPTKRRGGGNRFMPCPWGSPSLYRRCTTSGSSSRKKRRYEAPNGHTHERFRFLRTK